MRSMYLPKPALRHSLDQATLWEGKEGSIFCIYNWGPEFHYFLCKVYGSVDPLLPNFCFVCSMLSALGFYSSIIWYRCWESVIVDAKITRFTFIFWQRFSYCQVWFLQSYPLSLTSPNTSDPVLSLPAAELESRLLLFRRDVMAVNLILCLFFSML